MPEVRERLPVKGDLARPCFRPRRRDREAQPLANQWRAQVVDGCRALFQVLDADQHGLLCVHSSVPVPPCPYFLPVVLTACMPVSAMVSAILAIFSV